MTDRLDTSSPPKKRDRTHWLYIAVIVAVVAGVAVGLLAPDVGKSVGVLGTMFVILIKMMIVPVIFCTIVLGIGKVRAAATVGKVGGLAFVYFLAMSTVALAIGLVVGNLLSPGTGLNLEATSSKGSALADTAHEAGGPMEFVQHIIPTSLFSSLTEGNVLQALFVALLVGFALQGMGAAGDGILRGIEAVQKLVFKVLAMILWLAPIGAFGAIANVVGQTGWSAVTQLLTLMLMLPHHLHPVRVRRTRRAAPRSGRGVNLPPGPLPGPRVLPIFATSSSESALPRLIAKMEHLGVERTTVGVVVPTGYSFNLDGTAIYLTMASLFVADAMGQPLAIGEQISLLVFMIVASKGAAGVSGAGLATLAGGLQSHRPDLLDGVGLIVGIDRFMSEARAVTNFSGKTVATMLVGSWTKTVDSEQVERVLSGQDLFDELTMLDDHDSRAEEPAQAKLPAPV